MPKQHIGRLLVISLLWCTALAWAAPQAAQKKPKDQQEYELILSVQKETDANKRLQTLDQWKQKYTETEFKVERLGAYMQTYQQLGQVAKAIDAARELLGIEPANFGAQFLLASLAPFSGSSDPKLLADAESAAKSLLQAERPAHIAEPQWNDVKKQASYLAHQALGWTAMVQKKNDVAEQEFVKALEVNPNVAQVSYWLGSVVLAQKNPDKNGLALYSFARAAAFDGQGALTPAGRQQVDAYLTKIYKNYHGDESGLPELKQLAKTQPLPPADLKIKSADEISAEKEEELRKNNPLLAIFLQIKDGLTGADSANFWGQMKGTAMPKIRGRVLSAKPGVKPKLVELAVTQGQTAEVSVATPDVPARCLIEVGSDITIEGSEALEFQPSPFLIKMQGGKVIGGCKEAPAPVRKAPAGVKKAPAKAVKK